MTVCAAAAAPTAALLLDAEEPRSSAPATASGVR